MRVGIFVSETWGPGSTVGEIRDRAVRAEALGFVGAWVPYLPWAPDAMAAMQAAGEATSRIELGSAVIPTFFFHPLAMARQAATVQSAVGRPVHLGIGCSNPAIVAMHGLPFERPARHVQEYLQILNAAFEVGAKPAGAREQAGLVQHAGEIFELGSIYGTPGADAMGSVLVGAIGPKMLEVTGTRRRRDRNLVRRGRDRAARRAAGSCGCEGRGSPGARGRERHRDGDRAEVARGRGT